MAPNTPDFGYAGTGGPIPAVNIPTVWPYLKKISEENLRSDKKELSVWVTEIGWNSTTNLDIEQAHIWLALICCLADIICLLEYFGMIFRMMETHRTI